MINTFKDLTCPTGCTTGVQYKAIGADQTCVAVPNKSQLNNLIITPAGAPAVFDWSVTPITYVAASIDNTVTDNSKSKRLVGIGGVAEPDATERDMPNGVIAVTSRKYTVTFKTSVVDQANYDLLRQMQCGDLKFTFQYTNVGGHAFGDTSGISPSKIDVKLPLLDGKDDVEEGIIVLEYETTNGDPRRDTNPL